MEGLPRRLGRTRTLGDVEPLLGAGAVELDP